MKEEKNNNNLGEEQVEMSVAGIIFDPTNNMPIIILKDIHDLVAIPIWIGLVEASAIAAHIEGIHTTRPMTHDLLKNVLETLGGKLKHIAITDLHDNTFYAHLAIEQNNEVVEIDTRPSDAIALALRTHATMYVARKVIYKSQQIDVSAIQNVLEKNSAHKEGKSKEQSQNEKDRWTKILENLKPEDFGKYKT